MNTAYIELTTACNLRCSACYNRSGEGLATEIPLEKLVPALETLEHDLQVNRFMFSGGEPLLYSGLAELLSTIERMPDYSFMFSTNGTVHSEQFITAYMNMPHLNIQVSLDGSCEKINALSRGAGTYGQALRFFEKLRMPTKKPRVKMVVTRSNVADIESFYRLVLEIGGIPEFAYVTERGRATDGWENMSLSANEKVSVVQQIESMNKKTGAEAFLPLCDIGCPLSEEAAPLSMYIKPDGRVYPCQMLDEDEFLLGNIFALDIDSFAKVRKKTAQTAKKRESMDYSCHSCFMRGFCKRGCMAAAVANGGPLANDGNCDFRRQQYLKRELPMLRENK